MAEVAAMLISSPGSFDFSYVDQIAKDQQYNLLKHFESIYNEIKCNVSDYLHLVYV